MTESMTGSALPPAGWYPDAGGPGFARWWDGSAWTEHVQALGPAHAEPLAQDMSRPVTPVSLGQPGPIGVGMDPVDIVQRLQDAGEPAPVSPVDFVTGQHSTSAFLDGGSSGSGPSGSGGGAAPSSSGGGELVLSRRQRRELEASGTVLVEPATAAPEATTTTVAPEATVAERLAEAGTAAAAAPRASVVPPSPAPTIPPPGAEAPVAPAHEVVPAAEAAPVADVTPEPTASAAPTPEEIAAAIAARPRGARATARAATAAAATAPGVDPLIAAAVAAQPPVVVTTPSSAFGTSTAQTSLAGDPADAAPHGVPVDYPMSATVLQVELSVSIPSAPTVAPEFEALAPSAPGAGGLVEPARSPLAGLTGPQRIAPQAARATATAHPSLAAPGGPVAAPVAAAPAAPAPVSAATTAGATGFDSLLAMAPPPEPGTAAAPVTAGAARVAPPFAQAEADASAPARGRSFAQPASGEPGSADFGAMGRGWPGSVATPPQRAGRASTGAAWMLALSPLVGLIVTALVLADRIALAVPALAPVLTPVGGAIAGALALLPAAVAPFAPLLLGVVAIVLTVLLAALDARALASSGHANRPSAVWALLGPLVYLGVRAIVLRRAPGGQAPAWVNLALSIVAGAATAAAVVLLPSVATGEQLRMVESLIAQDLATQGVTATVACPDGILFGLGQTFTCEARDDLGVVGLSTVTVTGPSSVEWTTQLAAAPAE